MITNNFKAITKGEMVRASSSVGLFPVTRQDGSTYYYMPGTATNMSMSVTPSNNTAGFYIGSGTRAPAATDYSLQSRITSGFSASVNYSFINDNGTPALQAILTITNTGSTDLTIAEVGVFRIMQASNTQYTSTGSRNDAYMVERSVLASPVTIPPSDYTTIRFIAETLEEVTP